MRCRAISDIWRGNTTSCLMDGWVGRWMLGCCSQPAGGQAWGHAYGVTIAACLMLRRGHTLDPMLPRTQQTNDSHSRPVDLEETPRHPEPPVMYDRGCVNDSLLLGSHHRPATPNQ